jgi:hypothetical protein
VKQTNLAEIALGMFCHKKCKQFLKMETDCPSPFLGTFCYTKNCERIIHGDVSSKGRFVLGTHRYKIEGTDRSVTDHQGTGTK